MMTDVQNDKLRICRYKKQGCPFLIYFLKVFIPVLLSMLIFRTDSVLACNSHFASEWNILRYTNNCNIIGIPVEFQSVSVINNLTITLV